MSITEASLAHETYYHTQYTPFVGGGGFIPYLEIEPGYCKPDIVYTKILRFINV